MGEMPVKDGLKVNCQNFTMKTLELKKILDKLVVQEIKKVSESLEQT